MVRAAIQPHEGLSEITDMIQKPFKWTTFPVVDWHFHHQPGHKWIWYSTPDIYRLINSQCLLNPSEHLFIELFKTKPYEKILSARSKCVGCEDSGSLTRLRCEQKHWRAWQWPVKLNRDWIAPAEKWENRITSCQQQKVADVAFYQEQ